MTKPDLYLEKARRAFRAAEQLLENGDPDFAVSRHKALTPEGIYIGVGAESAVEVADFRDLESLVRMIVAVATEDTAQGSAP